MKYFKQYLKDFINFSGIFIPPESSGKDGYTLILKGQIQWISNQVINKAENEAAKLRIGFIKGDALFCLPYDYSEEIKYKRFLEVLSFQLKNNTNEKGIKNSSRQTRQEKIR